MGRGGRGSGNSGGNTKTRASIRRESAQQEKQVDPRFEGTQIPTDDAKTLENYFASKKTDPTSALGQAYFLAERDMRTVQAGMPITYEGVVHMLQEKIEETEEKKATYEERGDNHPNIAFYGEFIESCNQVISELREHESYPGNEKAKEENREQIEDRLREIHARRQAEREAEEVEDWGDEDYEDAALEEYGL